MKEHGVDDTWEGRYIYTKLQFANPNKGDDLGDLSSLGDNNKIDFKQ